MALNHEIEVIEQIKKILSEDKSIKYDLQGVYGIYDVIIKITADTDDKIRLMALDKLKNLENVQSAITMMVNQN